jgi:rubrerythrin
MSRSNTAYQTDLFRMALADPSVVRFNHGDYSLTDYYCLECGFEFTSTDAEHCPACGSDEILKAH